MAAQSPLDKGAGRGINLMIHPVDDPTRPKPARQKGHKPPRLWFVFLFVAYALADLLGHQLSGNDDWSTIATPGAAIGLVGALVLGRRAGFPIFFASFISPLIPGLGGIPAPTFGVGPLFLALLIAGGQTTQALLGSFFVRRFVGLPNSLVVDSQALKFLLLGGAVPCLLSSSWVTGAVLVVRPDAVHGDVLLVWWTRWVGETLGIFLLAPVAMTWFGSPKETWRGRRASLGIPLILTYCLSLVTFVAADLLQSQRLEMEFDRRTAPVADAIEQHLRSTLSRLQALKARFDSSFEKTLSKTEFHSFCDSIVTEDTATIQTLEWASGNESNFNYPIVWIHPRAGRETDTGVDLSNSTEFQRALERARTTGEPTSIPPTRLAHEPGATTGREPSSNLLVIQPVYEPTHRPGPEADLAGMIVCRIGLPELFQAATHPFDLQGIRFEVIDETIRESTRVLYSSPLQDVEPSGSASSSSLDGLSWSSSTAFAERSWQLVFTPFGPPQDWAAPQFPYLALLGILAFGSAMGSLLLVFSGRAMRIEQVVSERTAELSQSKQRLESTVEEQKRAEEQLQHQTKALQSVNAALQKFHSVAESANNAKSSFLANVSHEIRTPMTAILGFTEILQDNLEHKENLDALNTIRNNGQYLLDLINDILDISKIEANRLDVETIRFPLVDLLRDVRDLIKVRANAKNLSLHLEFGKDIPATIQSDPTRIRQILINLLGNGIKFTEKGGVRLVTDLVPGESNPLLRFTIIDSGIGMSEFAVKKLFQPFSQADSSTSRRFGGTGLGLAISKRLVELLGGKLTVESHPGEGSRFTATIDPGSLKGIETTVPDLNTGSPQTTLETSPVASLDCRILLAEDSRDNQRLLNHVLRKAGAEVTTVENGQLAIDEIRETQGTPEAFDVVLMDMQMPVMDGYDAVAQLRKDGESLPIIALTAHAMSGARQECLNAGCDDYAPKPINRRELLAQIARQIQGRRGTSLT